MSTNNEQKQLSEDKEKILEEVTKATSTISVEEKSMTTKQASKKQENEQVETEGGSNEDEVGEIPWHPPSPSSLSGTIPCSKQLPPGVYLVFMDRLPSVVQQEEGKLFRMDKTFFCVEPYKTCKEEKPINGMAVLKDSCYDCWTFQDLLLSILKPHGFELLSLVHFGPNNEQHATIVGPLPENESGKYMHIIFDQCPWLKQYMHFCAYGGD